MKTITGIDYHARGNHLWLIRRGQIAYHQPTPASLRRLRRVLRGRGFMTNFGRDGWSWSVLPL